jgi:hypothetical protein
MSLVFQNIDPPTPLSARRVGPPPQRRGVHTRRAERGGGGSIFWKTRNIGWPSYSNNLSTIVTIDFCDSSNFSFLNPVSQELLLDIFVLFDHFLNVYLCPF